MNTKPLRQMLAGLVGLLLLVAAGLGWAQPPAGKGSMPQALADCEAELAACLEEPCIVFPGDGQTGAPLRYEDNGDGTFTDLNTGLVWEIKTDDGTIHDVDNIYTWSTTGNLVDPVGTAFTQFLNVLNADQFAGYDNWRLPTVKELQSLVNYRYALPAATFPGEVGSSDNNWDYWSSTTPDGFVGFVVQVDFAFGYVSSRMKDSQSRARAVRGGE